MSELNLDGLFKEKGVIVLIAHAKEKKRVGGNHILSANTMVGF